MSSPSRKIVQNQVYSQQVQNLAESVWSSNPNFRSIKLDGKETHTGTLDARHLASRPREPGDVLRRPSPNFRSGQASNGGPRAGGFQKDRRSSEGRPSDRGPAKLGGKTKRSSRGDGEPRRRERNPSGGASQVPYGGEEKDFDAMLGKDEAMAESYLDWEDEKYPPNKPHSFLAVNKDMFVGHGPSLALGEWGMSEIVEEKLDQVTGDGMISGELRPQILAQKIVNGEWVRFHDDEERDSVASLAKYMAERNAVLQSEQKGQIVEPFDTTFQPLSAEQTEKMTTQLLTGAYDESELPATVKDILLRVRSGGAVSQSQMDSLTKKVRSMLPVQRTPRPVRAPAVGQTSRAVT